MNPAINEMPVTQEEDEAMDALCRLATGRPMLEINPTTQDILNNIAIPQPTPDIGTIINTICAQLQLLTTVIKQNQGNSLNAEDQSLQECVNLTLQQAGWFKEMVKEVIDDVDMEYEIESAVESYFSNSFSLDDHVDITAEVENRIEEIVEEQLADIVSDKLRNLRITFD
jgi:hypothetical protein